MKDISKYKLYINWNIGKAMKAIDDGGIGFGVCCDLNEKVIGVITDGDFRRGVLNGLLLSDSVQSIVNKSFVCVESGYDEYELSEIFKNPKIRALPVINNGLLENILTRHNQHTIDTKSVENSISGNDVVVMAGGFGTRLDPFTRILPKPLIPIGNEPIIKLIMDEFHNYGANNFHVTLNDKAKMVRAYFSDHKLGYDLTFTEEKIPLGTAGALRLLKKTISDQFFLTNCDIIVKNDYSNVIEFHNDNKYDITIISSLVNHSIPYGVCEVKNGGDLISLKEKPQLNILINTGFYFINKDVLGLIPRDIKFDMTDLIESSQSNGFKVGAFPISEDSWVDIGQWAEYRKTVELWAK